MKRDAKDVMSRERRISRTLNFIGLIVLFTLVAVSSADSAPEDLYMAMGLRDPGQVNQIVRVDKAQNRTVFEAGGHPYGMVFDRTGHLFVSTGPESAILKFAPDGTRTVFATSLGTASGIAFDNADNLLVADVSGNVIHKITPNGTQTVYATGIDGPSAIAVDRFGNLFCSESRAGNILRFTPAGERTTVASGLALPQALAFSDNGDLYAIEGATTPGVPSGIFKIAPDGTRTLFGRVSYRGLGLAFDKDGNLWASDNAQGLLFEFDPAGHQIGLFGDVQSPLHLAFQPGRTARPLNLSTRAFVTGGESVLIGGIISLGTAPKKVLVRAIGASLGQRGISQFLANPRLDLYDADGNRVASNANWKINESTQQSQEEEIKAAALAPENDLDSALIATLLPQEPYTAVVRSEADGTGIAVVETYDLDGSAPDARLANVSTRSLVQTGEQVMIGGFILGASDASSTFVARAIGPSLASAGIANVLPDPTMEVFNAQGTAIAGNDNWPIDDQTGASQAALVYQTTLAPRHNLESAVILRLPAGAYTIIVSDKTGATGVGVVELFSL